MRTTGIVAALLVSLSLLSFSQAQSDELSASYFPLKAGMRWEYTVTSTQGPTQKLLITNLAPREVSGAKVTPRKSEMGGAAFIEFMKQDDTGVYRYAEQKGAKASPDLVTPMECHLKFPITQGNNWNMGTKVGNSTVNLNLSIESVSDQVMVPAGTFKDCLKVKQVGENAAGTTVLGYEWYAPKVGVVKSMVTIKQNPKGGIPSSENLIYQLVSFKP
jgi:hypothetical protein